jgi:phosphosulfolactate phosphohydrolase-like enzyme
MKKIDVCLSPDLIHLYDLSSVAVVVVDIFRATSCMVTAFASGASEIVPVEEVEARFVAVVVVVATLVAVSVFVDGL